MTVHERLLSLLHESGVPFRVIEHPAAGGSDEVARLRGTAPSQGAKAMVCRVSGTPSGPGHLLAVLPGDRRVDFRKVAAAAGARKARFASPEEAQAVTGCTMGAVPPVTFSSSLLLLVDAGLLPGHDEIAFNAGRLDQSIIVASRDYTRITNPVVTDLTATDQGLCAVVINQGD
ncbi:YbaK/EbsC family protein [Streptomyces sp. NPDC048425]